MLTGAEARRPLHSTGRGMERAAPEPLTMPAVAILPTLAPTACRELTLPFSSAPHARALAGRREDGRWDVLGGGARRCMGRTPSMRSGCVRATAKSPPDTTTKLSMPFSYHAVATAAASFSSANPCHPSQGQTRKFKMAGGSKVVWCGQLVCVFLQSRMTLTCTH